MNGCMNLHNATSIVHTKRLVTNVTPDPYVAHKLIVHMDDGSHFDINIFTGNLALTLEPDFHSADVVQSVKESAPADFSEPGVTLPISSPEVGSASDESSMCTCHGHDRVCEYCISFCGKERVPHGASL